MNRTKRPVGMLHTTCSQRPIVLENSMAWEPSVKLKNFFPLNDRLAKPVLQARKSENQIPRFSSDFSGAELFNTIGPERSSTPAAANDHFELFQEVTQPEPRKCSINPTGPDSFDAQEIAAIRDQCSEFSGPAVQVVNQVAMRDPLYAVNHDGGLAGTDRSFNPSVAVYPVRHAAAARVPKISELSIGQSSWMP